MDHEQTPLMTDAAPPAELRSVGEGERIAALDVLRGFAIFGIFMVNIAFFSMPLFHAMDAEPLADAPFRDQAAWFIIKAFFEVKFISLFSFLFGVGMILQMMRLESRGAAFVPVYVRRLIGLAIIGLLHGLLIWYGDILFMYAIAGFVLLFCRSLDVRTLLTIAAVSFLVGGLIIGTCLGAGYAGERFFDNQDRNTVAAEAERGVEPAAQGVAENGAVEDDRWQRFTEAWVESGFDPDHPSWAEAETIAYKEGPFLAALAIRSFTYMVGHTIFAGIFLGYFPRIIGLFLLGAALMKLKFFAQHRRPWHWRCLLLGAVVGLPLEVAVALAYPATGWGFSGPVLLGEFVHYFSSFALMLGYVGAICLIVHSGLLRWITGALACAGRMALTNYIGQSVITTFIMYWWGLSLFGEFTRAQQVGLVIAIFAGQVALSVIWLRFFTIGPLEWLWRAATYFRRPAIVRRA